MSSIPHASGIYKFTCKPTGRVYVGSAVSLRRRHKNHLDELRTSRHKNSYLQRAWNKYGESAFEFTVIELVLAPFLLEREQYWMDKLHACDRSKGFNILPNAGSRYGSITSEETKRKISEKLKLVPRRKMTEDERVQHGIRMRNRVLPADFGERVARGQRGKIVSPETRAKLSARFKGIPLDPEVGKRIAAKLRGRKRDPEAVRKTALANTGKKRSEEARQKISDSARRNTSGAKQYIVTSPDGEEILVKNLTAFCAEHGLIVQGMFGVVAGRKKSHRGWKCRRGV